MHKKQDKRITFLHIYTAVLQTHGKRLAQNISPRRKNEALKSMISFVTMKTHKSSKDKWSQDEGGNQK